MKIETPEICILNVPDRQKEPLIDWGLYADRVRMIDAILKPLLPKNQKPSTTRRKHAA